MFRLKPDSRAWTFFQSMLRVPPLPFWFVRFLSPVTLFDRHHYKTCFKNIKDSNIFTWSSPIGYFCIYVINQTMQLIFGLSVLRIPLYILMVIVIRRIELFHSSSWIYATLTIKKRRTSSSLSYIARKNLNYSNIQPPYFSRLFEVRRRVHHRAISRTNWCPFSTACSGLVMCNNADLLNYRMQDFYINCKVLVPISSDQPSNFLHNNCAVTCMEKGWFHCQRSIYT